MLVRRFFLPSLERGGLMSGSTAPQAPPAATATFAAHPRCAAGRGAGHRRRRMIHYVNLAAEQFFGIGAAASGRHPLTELVPADSPFFADRAGAPTGQRSEIRRDAGDAAHRRFCHRARGAARRQRRTLSSCRCYEQSIARKIDRQLSHRNAARSVTAMAGDAGARGQEPALGHSRRRAVAGAVGAEQRPRADPPDLRRDRPDRRPGRPHGGVLRQRRPIARGRQHPPGPGARAQGRPERFRAASASSRPTTHRCPTCSAPRPADPGLPQPD